MSAQTTTNNNINNNFFSSSSFSSSNSSFISKIFRGHAGAATMAGILEIAFFHPFDTIAKRLMSHRSSICGNSFTATRHNLNNVIFKKHSESSFIRKIMYLYPGSLFAVFYKVLQRVYKFAGQPIVRDYLNYRYGYLFKYYFGCRDRLFLESSAGCLIGIGEIILLPLDRLKIISQTNEKALNSGIFNFLKNEGIRGMYAGALITSARNAPGSFCLFGGAAVTKEIIFKLENYSNASTFQNICSSAVGACLSITITNPMDVIKTRQQNKGPGEVKEGAIKIINKLLKEEGMTALGKGLTPKIIASAPKLVFAYTMTELFMQIMKK